MADGGQSGGPSDTTNNRIRLQRQTIVEELNPSINGPPRILRWNEHGVEDLVEAVARMAEQEMTWEVLGVCQEFRDWLKNLEGPGMPSTESMLQALDILCRLLFPCPIPGLAFHWNSSIVGPDGPSAGYTRREPCGIIKIVLDPTRIHNEGANVFISRIISTLLHELCHAYIKRFACLGDCQIPGCKDGTAALIGETGHGKAWQRLACHIQVAMCRRLPELKIELCPLIHLIFEARQGVRLRAEDFAFLWEDFGMQDAWSVIGNPPNWTWQQLDAAYADSTVGSGGLMMWITDRVQEAHNMHHPVSDVTAVECPFGATLDSEMMRPDTTQS